jgi:hypothetical protein
MLCFKKVDEKIITNRQRFRVEQAKPPSMPISPVTGKRSLDDSNVSSGSSSSSPVKFVDSKYDEFNKLLAKMPPKKQRKWKREWEDRQTKILRELEDEMNEELEDEEKKEDE